MSQPATHPSLSVSETRSSRRFYVEAQYAFDESATTTILRLSHSPGLALEPGNDVPTVDAFTETAVVFEDQTGIVVSVNIALLDGDDDLIDALAEALDYANVKLCALTRETAISIPLPWAVKVVDGAAMEQAMLMRAELPADAKPDDGLAGVGANE